MRTLDKYLTEAKMPLKANSIKQMLTKPKAGTYEIDGKKVVITVVGDTMVWKYPSNFHELTYILVDVSDDVGYDYQQIGLGKKDTMKFVIDMNG